MKNKNTEYKIAKYFNYQEKCFNLPGEEKIRAFNAISVKPKIEHKRIPKIKYISITAACLAFIISVVSVVVPLMHEDPVSQMTSETESAVKDIEFFGEATKVDGIADWYEPGEFNVETIVLEKADSIAVKPEGMFQTMSFKTMSDVKEQLPDWVIGVNMINERYATLYYEFPVEEYEHGYIMYDLQENKIVTLGDKIYAVVGDFLESRNINERPLGELIIIEEFGANPEWCIFRTWNDTVEPNIYERYLVNIETGEFHQLPTSDILAISSDYKHFVFCRDERLENGELVERVISYYDVKTKEEKVITTTQKGENLSMHHALFSDDDRYIISYIYNGANGGWDTVNAKWIIYDVQTGKINNGNGKIIRYTEKNDAVIVKNNEGGRIYRLSDMQDVTDSYELNIYECYEFETVRSGDYRSLYLKPLFERGETVLIADNIVNRMFWDDYVYIYQAGSEEVLVYSVRNNQYFSCSLSLDESVNSDKNNMTFMFIMESGKKCRIVSYYDPMKE